MAVAHRASAAMGSVLATTSGTIVIPASVQAGDALFIASVNGSGTGALSVTDDDSGGNTWTEISQGTGSGGRGAIWWKRATSATASKTVTLSGATNSISAVLSAFSGAVASGNQFDPITTEGNLSGNETHAGITPGLADSMICFAVCNVDNDNAVSSQTCTNPGALTELIEHLCTGGTDTETSIAAALQSGGPTVTGTISWAQTNGVTITFAWAIPPSVAPTPSLPWKKPGRDDHHMLMR